MSPVGSVSKDAPPMRHYEQAGCAHTRPAPLAMHRGISGNQMESAQKTQQACMQGAKVLWPGVASYIEYLWKSRAILVHVLQEEVGAPSCIKKDYRVLKIETI